MEEPPNLSGDVMKLTVLAKSSGTEPYEVDFIADGNSLVVFCSCQAGSFGKLCKHKTELLAGDESRLFSESEIPKLERVQGLVRRAPELTLLAEEITESERIVKSEQAKLKKAKKRLETALKQGVSLGKE